MIGAQCLYTVVNGEHHLKGGLSRLEAVRVVCFKGVYQERNDFDVSIRQNPMSQCICLECFPVEYKQHQLNIPQIVYEGLDIALSVRRDQLCFDN